MHDHLLRHDSELSPPQGGVAQAWAQGFRGTLRGVLRAALLSLMTLASCIALADVYTEVNDKISSGQWSAAQTLIERQLQKQPADPQIRLMQSQMQTAQGQTAQAIETLQALTQEFPELPEPYNNLAVLYAGQQRFDEAARALVLAIRARPDYSLALENLGDVLIAQARQSYLKAQSLPLPGASAPLMGQRLANKIQLTGQLLQAAKP
jgi:Flp pilus assembly protein TadD